MDNSILESRCLANKQEEKDRSKLLDTLLATVAKGGGYTHQAEQLEILRKYTLNRLRDRIVEEINEQLEVGEYYSYDRKLGISRWLNNELRRFDIAISSSKVGGLAILSADAAKRDGRFFLRQKTQGENQKPKYFYSDNLFEILAWVEFVEAKRREPLVRWTEKTSTDPDKLAD